MTSLYDARGSFRVLRSKFTIKLPTQTAWAPFGPESAGKGAVPNWGSFFSQGSTERILIAPFLPNAYVCNVLAKKGFDKFPLLWAEKQYMNQIREVEFSPIFADFRVLSPPSKNSNWHNFVNIGI